MIHFWDDVNVVFVWHQLRRLNIKDTKKQHFKWQNNYLSLTNHGSIIWCTSKHIFSFSSDKPSVGNATFKYAAVRPWQRDNSCRIKRPKPRPRDLNGGFHKTESRIKPAVRSESPSLVSHDTADCRRKECVRKHAGSLHCWRCVQIRPAGYCRNCIQGVINGCY